MKSNNSSDKPEKYKLIGNVILVIIASIIMALLAYFATRN